MQVFDPHAIACFAPVVAPSLSEPPNLVAIARALSEPEAVLVTAGAAEVEGPAPDILVVFLVVVGEGSKRERRKAC